jgi:glycosyltransferase involved in cell wall biosynthesis
MGAKKIVIVSSTFYPENSPRSHRTTELVKELARQGHQVTLYTLKIDEFHVPIEREFGIEIKDIGKRRFTSINTAEGSKIHVLFKRVINRFLLQLFLYPDIELMFMVKKALSKERKLYDLLISVAVPHSVHWGTAWAKSKNNPIANKWVADCGDPFMGSNHDSFKKLFYFKYLEKWFCRKADYIAVPKIMMKENYYKEFQDKVIEIPQGFKFDRVVATSFKKNPIPTFAFAGTLIKSTRNPSFLLDHLLSVKEPFKFIFYTENQNLVLPYKLLLKDKLEIRHYIPRIDLLKELSTMDFLVNIAYDPVHQAPSKLIDYYITGRPILSSLTNEFDTAVVDSFLKGDYSKNYVFDSIEKFRIENVAAQFLDCID